MRLFLHTQKILNIFINILFPIRCLGCKKNDAVLCEYCLSKIRFAERETDEQIRAVYDYRDPLIKKAIWELKYHHKRFIGKKLGELLYEYFMEDIEEMRIFTPGRPILVIPVPISKKKTKTRGYNQALFIAKGFCDKDESNIFELKNNIVYKKINNIPQARITNRKRRLENVKGVFEIKNKEIIKGRTIIIIDDVTTTGGTINEIIKILKKVGAKKVVGFAVAH